LQLVARERALPAAALEERDHHPVADVADATAQLLVGRREQGVGHAGILRHRRQKPGYSSSMAAFAEGQKDATPITQAHNRAVLDALPFGDTRDFEDARRGFLGTLPEVEIKNDQGRVVWSLRDYASPGDEPAPPTVTPSLWRQARLNMHNGLFQVTDRIYQIRGFDI